MKKILIIHTDMEIGGAETSLIGLLQTIDYTRYAVDLMLYRQQGPLMPLVPEQVSLVRCPACYTCLALPIKDVALKYLRPDIAAARILGKIRGRRGWSDATYVTKQYSVRYALPFLSRIPGRYDAAISFIDPHFVLAKVDAAAKLAWMHTDFSRIDIPQQQDRRMWELSNHIVLVSEQCKTAFDNKHPQLRDRSVVIENILSPSFLEQRSMETDVDGEMPRRGIRLLSIGRFSQPKNFDNVPRICRSLIDRGLDVYWYIIGYGSDEALIRSKIAESGMERRVIILGRKDNPYPYIRACDYYLQPSRFEGKSVAVREAQILHKPVIITNYATAASQLTDGVDGVIVPLDCEGCAEGIARVITDAAITETIIDGTRHTDYSNRDQVDILYSLI